MKLLIDMNLSPRWVKMLTEAEFEASHWSSLGSPDAPDAEIMSFARTNGYVVLTHDLDFSAILAATRDAKPSVVQIRAADVRPETMGPVLIEALRQMAVQLEEGALLTLDPPERDCVCSRWIQNNQRQTPSRLHACASFSDAGQICRADEPRHKICRDRLKDGPHRVRAD